MMKKDVFTSTPLELAYAWSLLCRSYARKALTLPGGTKEDFSIKAVKFAFGRLVDGPRPEDNLINLDKIAKETIYVVAEKGRTDSLNSSQVSRHNHPCFDIFFLSDEDELVVIDVYGGINQDSARDKLSKLDAWIERHGATLSNKGLKAYGYVLGPKLKEKVENQQYSSLVWGSAAKELLGALGQLYEWFDDGESDTK